MKLGKLVDFFWVFLIFIMSFFIFKYVFTGAQDSLFYQNIISALMGTILTIVITSFLLKQQAKSE